jgi:hypothetical protein
MQVKQAHGGFCGQRVGGNGLHPLAVVVNHDEQVLVP